MVVRIVQDASETPLKALRGKIVAIIGFGNQGRAQAANLRDSKLNVVIGTRAGSSSSKQAGKDGFSVMPIEDAARDADLVILGVPDEVHGEVYDQLISPNMRSGTTLGVMHGFSLRFDVLKPRNDIGVVMVAPKGPGTTLRDRFTRGQGIPCLCGVHQNSPADDAERIALAWAAGIGCLRAAAIFTTVAAEAETDLFGEQTVLCGGVTALIRTAFETLISADYPPELAYIECCHELKQVADLIYARGLAGMHKAISGTAEFGSYVAQQRLIDDALRQRMRAMLEDIRTGKFAREMLDDHKQGSPRRRAFEAGSQSHPIEPAGEVVRALMPWLAGDGEPGA
jgi:ketol-acid reductoisomerase